MGNNEEIDLFELTAAASSAEHTGGDDEELTFEPNPVETETNVYSIEFDRPPMLPRPRPLSSLPPAPVSVGAVFGAAPRTAHPAAGAAPRAVRPDDEADIPVSLDSGIFELKTTPAPAAGADPRAARPDSKADIPVSIDSGAFELIADIPALTDSGVFELTRDIPVGSGIPAPPAAGADPRAARLADEADIPVSMDSGIFEVGANIPPPPPLPPVFTKIAHVCLYVRDLEKSIAFYTRLGFKRRFVFNRSGSLFGAYLEFGDGNFIELFEDPACVLSAVRGRLAHFCLETPDIDAAIMALDAAGVEHGPKKLGCDSTYQIWLKDPDGNDFEIHQYTPKSSQLVGGDVEADW